MKAFSSRIWSAILSNGKSLIFVFALLGMSFGFWLAWEPLGFIVPCSLILALMVLAQLRPAKIEERNDDA